MLTRSSQRIPYTKSPGRRLTDADYEDLCAKATHRVLENHKFGAQKYEQLFSKATRGPKILNLRNMPERCSSLTNTGGHSVRDKKPSIVSLDSSKGLKMAQPVESARV